MAKPKDGLGARARLPLPKQGAIDDVDSSDLFALCAALAQTFGAPRSAAKGNVPDNDVRRPANALGVFVRWALSDGRPDAFNGKLLTFLSPQEREDRVEAAIGSEDETKRADALAGLGAGMAHLTEPQRDRLVDAAIGINHEGDKAVALAGLGAGMAHLTEPQRKRLVDAATGIKDEKYMALAVAGLGVGMGHWEPGWHA